jgi:hypothetical protein
MQLHALFQLQSLYLLSLLLFGTALVLSLLNAWNLKRKAATAWAATMLSIRTTSIIVLKRTPKVALILLASHSIVLVIGYHIRDAELASKTEKLKDVLVVKDFGNNQYRLEMQGSRFNAVFDPHNKLDWLPGQKMKKLNYEQQTGFKTVVGNNLGFEFWTDNNGNRILFEVKPEVESKKGAYNAEAIASR